MIATKPAWQSKINILGVLTFLAGLGTFVDVIPPNYTKYVLLISGISVAILRTFYTNTITTVNGAPTTAVAPPAKEAGG